MRSRFLSLMLVAALLAGSTGLLLALHLLEADGGHDAHQCETCVALLHQPRAVTDGPALVAVELAVAGDVAAVPESTPHASRPDGTLGPRAPPCVA